jgi:hypothetical protein
MLSIIAIRYLYKYWKSRELSKNKIIGSGVLPNVRESIYTKMKRERNSMGYKNIKCKKRLYNGR